MSPAEAVGTPYGGATGLLHAQVLMPGAGHSHSLFLSLFDHGDRTLDSAVFIDNLTLTPSPGSCPKGVTSLGPAVAITGPTIAATVNTSTPTLTGTAGNAVGDAPTVAVRIYNGAVPAGAPVQTLSAPRIGNSWSAQAAALAPGQYTAQATQANAQADGVSAPTTFTVPPGAAGGGAGARAASRAPAIATTTASRTTRTPPMARCRRSPARRSTRAWSPATSSSSTRRAPGRGRR